MNPGNFTVRGMIIVALSMIWALAVAQSRPNVSQDSIAQLLLGNARAQQIQALQSLEGVKTDDISPTVRTAMIEVLRRENRRVGASSKETQGQQVAPLSEGDADFYPTIIESVIRLRDPDSVSALAGALGTGMMVVRALSAFGDDAVPDVAAVVQSPESPAHQVDDGLRVLRLVAEGRDSRPLRASTLQTIRAVAAQRLTGRQSPTTIWNAADLAASLGDPQLLRRVESLARDRREVITMGVSEVALIEQVQARAAAALVRGRQVTAEE